MKHLLLTLLLVAGAASAQNGNHTDYHEFGYFSEDDKTATVFADVANLRKSPDVQSKIGARLTIGAEVEILELTEKPFEAKGLQTFWIKVRAGKETGYLPATSLTKGKLDLSDGRFVLWGILEKKTGEDGRDQFFASVRVVDASGVVQSRQDFEVMHGDRPADGYLSVYPAPQIGGIQHLIVYETLSEACGVYASSHYMLYDDSGRLHFVGSGWSMGDSGVLHSVKSYVFPYPESPDDYERGYHFKPGEEHIFCVENDGSYDDNCLWVETSTVADFTWNGESLEKACEY